MRINQFVAQATGLSRRSTDQAISGGRVKVNDQLAVLGLNVETTDKVTLDSKVISLPSHHTTLLINKPVGYVCSRDGQGSPTIYDLIPEEYRKLKHVGRLDKDSSGLVILTDDGDLAHNLTHPKFNKLKIYEVKLNKALDKSDRELIETGKISLDGKPSIMKIKDSPSQSDLLEIELSEGRNRQIRRTFAKLGYEVVKLNREMLAQYKLSTLNDQTFIDVS